MIGNRGDRLRPLQEDGNTTLSTTTSDIHSFSAGEYETVTDITPTDQDDHVDDTNTNENSDEDVKTATGFNSDNNGIEDVNFLASELNANDVSSEICVNSGEVPMPPWTMLPDLRLLPT